MTMTLHITDPVLDALAEQAQRILNAPSKEDAVRQALVRVVGTPSEETTVVPDDSTRRERLEAIRKRYLAMGKHNPDFDEKKFLDDMWES
jgi:antitoxin VapB